MYSIIASIIIATVYIIQPVAIFVILAYSVKRELLESPFFIKYFGTLTYGLRTKSKYQLAYPLVSCAMRFGLTIILVRD